MIFPFRFRKKNIDINENGDHQNKNEIIDGEFTEIRDTDNENEGLDIRYLDQDVGTSIVSFNDACQKLGIDYGGATEAEVKQAYYQKRQEIRSCSLKDENRILLNLKNAYELILNHPEIMNGKDTTNTDSKNEGLQEAPKETTDIDKETEGENAGDELMSWDDLMEEIDSGYKSAKQKKTFRKIILVVMVMIMIAGVCGAYTEVKNVRTLPCGMTDTEIIEFIAEYRISLKHDQNVVIEQSDIARFENEQAIYVPLVQLYLQKCSYLVTKGIASIKVSAIFIGHYQTDGGSITYVPVYLLRYKTETELDLIGRWVGIFRTGTNNQSSNSAIITITKDEGGKLIGICEIEADNGKKGSYFTDINQIKDTVDVSITGKKWIDKPTFFIMSDFDAYYNLQKDELLPADKESNIFTFSKECVE